MTQHIDATPGAVTAAIERVDFSAATLAELAQLVGFIEAHWPLDKLSALSVRHRSPLDDLDHWRTTEPRYRPPDDPTPIAPVLSALEGLDMSTFTPAQVDRIGSAMFRFGSVPTWRNFIHLHRLKAKTPDAKQTLGSDE